MVELKKGWRRVKFGDVVRLNKETSKDPSAEGIERVIGLEHLEPGDLRVRNWAPVNDDTKFTNRVRPGQVLFGKRRAYQRKVARAEFDAVCSGDIYVFESANPEGLLPELLPFICQTDSFFEHAVGTSAGSLSPRTNWSSLAKYEFALPPLEEQERAVGALAAAGAALEANREVLAAARTVVESLCDQLTCIPDSDSELGTIATVTKLAGFEYTKHVEYVPNGEVIAIRPTNIKNGRLDLTDVRKISRDTSDALPRSKVMRGDVVFTYIGMYIGEVLHIEENDRFHLAPNIARISPSEALNGRYLLWSLRSRAVRQQIQAAVAGTYTRSFTMASLRRLRISLPPTLDEQVARADAIDQAWGAQLMAEKRIESTHTVYRELIRSALENS